MVIEVTYPVQLALGLGSALALVWLFVDRNSGRRGFSENIVLVRYENQITAARNSGDYEAAVAMEDVLIGQLLLGGHQSSAKTAKYLGLMDKDRKQLKEGSKERGQADGLYERRVLESDQIEKVFKELDKEAFGEEVYSNDVFSLRKGGESRGPMYGKSIGRGQDETGSRSGFYPTGQSALDVEVDRIGGQKVLDKMWDDTADTKGKKKGKAKK